MQKYKGYKVRFLKWHMKVCLEVYKVQINVKHLHDTLILLENLRGNT